MQYSLTALYGIGRTRSRKLLDQVGIPYDQKTKDVDQEKEGELRKAVQEYVLEGDLRREVSQNIKRLKDIQSNRGDRHARNLPTRGQRTKTNSRTRRGNRRMTMTSGRRKVEKT